MDNRLDVETGQVHCGKCNKRLDWNNDRNAFTECSCQLTPSPDARVFTVTALNPIPSAASMTLRDWFAGQASEHDLVYYVRLNPAISPAEARWMFADDMLKAREVKP